MRDRSGQLYVAHPFTAYFRSRNFNTAAVANNALVADFLVLATVAFPVLGRAENALAKQAVFFRPQRAVVNRFRFGHFSI